MVFLFIRFDSIDSFGQHTVWISAAVAVAVSIAVAVSVAVFVYARTDAYRGTLNLLSLIFKMFRLILIHLNARNSKANSMACASGPYARIHTDILPSILVFNIRIPCKNFNSLSKFCESIISYTFDVIVWLLAGWLADCFAYSMVVNIYKMNKQPKLHKLIGALAARVNAII